MYTIPGGSRVTVATFCGPTELFVTVKPNATPHRIFDTDGYSMMMAYKPQVNVGGKQWQQTGKLAGATQANEEPLELRINAQGYHYLPWGGNVSLIGGATSEVYEVTVYQKEAIGKRRERPKERRLTRRLVAGGAQTVEPWCETIRGHRGQVVFDDAGFAHTLNHIPIDWISRTITLAGVVPLIYDQIGYW